MEISPSSNNPDCPECGHEKTKVYNQLVKTFSYKCPECGVKFKPEEANE